VERVYHVFDTFVLNSFAEGMSNTLLEAMASGLPIICTAVGGNVELVADGKTGILIGSGDDRKLTFAIQEYVKSPQDRGMHAASARRFVVENFSIGHMIDQYAALYDCVA
jgi:glycosyltransferase involved in cell wall biosynthesis